ncbi:MAG: RNA polymerase sigma factor [Chloroflexi bacterium]|nr:RNA polymerase sigma factor [Chloroflexota bacterium]
MPVSDDKIILRAQQGERDQFMHLFNRYYARVESYARRLLSEREAAEDVASETFVHALRNLHAYRAGETSSYLAYLLMICRRLAINEGARRLRRNTSLDDLPESDTPAAVDPLPLDRVLVAEQREAVRLGLEALSPGDREIIHLAFEKDLSRQDIMRVLDKPTVSAVTSHLHRAMRNLKAILVRQGYFAENQELERR